MNDFCKRHLEGLPPAAGEGCTLCPLPEPGLLRIEGEDAREFLQGQLTNDIFRVTPERAQLSAWCTPRGRMLALFLVFMHDGALHLLLPAERLEAVRKRLQMFVLRARVTIEPVQEPALCGLAGACAEAIPDGAPEAAFGVHSAGGVTRVRLPGERPRLLLAGGPEALAGLLDGLPGRPGAAEATCWTLEQIRAGIPQVYDATAEAFVPQMCNLDLLEGVSFTKGCYTGQEVVARMRYLGQLKRRMYVARIETDACPAPGDPLFSPTSRSAQGAGRVVEAAPSPQGGCEALVVAEIAAFEAGDLRLGDENGPPLELREPPYGLEGGEDA